MIDQKPDILEILAFRRMKREQLQELLCKYAISITRVGQEKSRTESQLRAALNNYLDERHLSGIKRNQLINRAISKALQALWWSNFRTRNPDGRDEDKDKASTLRTAFFRDLSKLDRVMPKKTPKVSVKKRSRKGRR